MGPLDWEWFSLVSFLEKFALAFAPAGSFSLLFIFLFIHSFSFILFCDKVSPCSLGWSGALDASVYRVRVSDVCRHAQFLLFISFSFIICSSSLLPFLMSFSERLSRHPPAKQALLFHSATELCLVSSNQQSNTRTFFGYSFCYLPLDSLPLTVYDKPCIHKQGFV